MANTLEYIFSLQDKVSAKIQNIAGKIEQNQQINAIGIEI